MYHLQREPQKLDSNMMIVIQELYFFLMFLFIFEERERQSMSGGGAEREGDTESETGSRLRAVSTEPHAGLELTDHRS